MLFSLVSLALAQGAATHHPVVPSAGLAHENGPGAMWVNPANLAYDIDARYGVFVHQPVATGDRLPLPTSTGVSVGAGGFGLGVHNLLREGPGDEIRSDWSIDYATGIQLPERVSLGLLMSWNFMDSASNYFAYDAGV